MTTQNTNLAGMLNPLTPEAWVLFDTALYRLYEHTSIGCLMAIIWDILQSLPDEVTLLFQNRFNFAQIFYVGARVGPLLFMASQAVFVHMEHELCYPWIYAISATCVLTHISSGFLFLLRGKVLYNDSIWVQRALTLAWSMHAGVSFVTFNGFSAMHIGPTSRCFATAKDPFIGILLLSQAFYEILVCSAITYKLCMCAAGQDDKPLKFWWSLWRRRDPLERIRSRFLQDSQIYFLIAISLKTTQIIIYFLGNPILMVISPLLNVTITGILATKIYRQFKLGQPGLFGGAIRIVAASSYTQNESWTLQSLPRATHSYPSSDSSQHCYKTSLREVGDGIDLRR